MAKFYLADCDWLLASWASQLLSSSFRKWQFNLLQQPTVNSSNRKERPNTVSFFFPIKIENDRSKNIDVIHQGWARQDPLARRWCFRGNRHADLIDTSHLFTEFSSLGSKYNTRASTFLFFSHFQSDNKGKGQIKIRCFRNVHRLIKEECWCNAS